MELNLIFGGEATLEDMYELNEKKGLEFVIEDGNITEVIYGWLKKKCLKIR